MLALPVFCAFSSYAQTTATLVLLHGNVWTGAPNHPDAQAIAVVGDRIVAVGTDQEIQRWIGTGTKVLDLHGRRVVPGFNDAHVHFMDGADALTGPQLHDARSAEDLRRILKAYVVTIPAKEWVEHGNWDHELWEHPELPTHVLIDDVTPNNPVAIWRVDGHMVLANALAMKLCGVTRETPDVAGGVIVRDAEGNPTGIFKDAATGLITKHLPPMTPEQMQRALRAGMRYAAEHGVTSAQNMAGFSADPRTTSFLQAVHALDVQGEQTIRLSFYPALIDWKQIPHMRQAFESPNVHIPGVKIFADGSLGARTAWMFDAYADDPTTHGLAGVDLLHPEQLLALIKEVDKAGLQIATHAIGDRANQQMLNLYEQLEQANGVRDRRLRIEHAQNIAPSDVARFSQLHVIASMQPYHAIDAGQWAGKRLGPEREQRAHPWHTLQQAHAILAFGSDWPVAPMNPLLGIYAATTRRTLDGRHPEGWIPQQKISVEAALTAYTTGAAYAEFQNGEKGSLQPGKLADIVVLSDDILHEDPIKIENTKVVWTVMGGKIVYDQSARSR